MYEIELRGPLGKGQAENLMKVLEAEGKLLKQTDEKLLFFETRNFGKIGSFEKGNARLSLKIVNGSAKLRLKYGNALAQDRKEESVEILNGDSRNLLNILYNLGIEEAFYRPTVRWDYFIDGITVSIKTNCVMGDHFEIERLVDENNDTFLKYEMQKLIDFANTHNLSIWSKDDYKNRVTSLMKEYPPVNINEIPII
jgi:adenylate cyclase class IV